MDVLVTHAPLQFPAHARKPATRSGLPDSAYWTAYDHYMIEREARASRRAYVWSSVAAFARRMRQIISKFRPARA
jgi:hypothetical protein